MLIQTVVNFLEIQFENGVLLMSFYDVKNFGSNDLTVKNATALDESCLKVADQLIDDRAQP